MEHCEFLWEEAKKKLIDIINHYKFKNILFSYSGGKDSTVVYHLLKELNLLDKINIVFSNTHMEFDAINEFIEKFDNVEIIEPKTALPLIYLKYGLPIHSKYTSEMIHRLQKHNFDFKNDTFKSFNDLIYKYPNCKSCLMWLCKKMLNWIVLIDLKINYQVLTLKFLINVVSIWRKSQLKNILKIIILSYQF